MDGNAALFEAIRSRLVESIHPERIVVFGSRARGEERPDSDLDLLVVADVGGSLAERSRAVRLHLLDIEVPIDLVVYSRDEFARLRQWRTSLAGIADRGGKVLHG